MSKPEKAADNTARKQRGLPFKPGQSGNPAGKPPGARHKTTLAIESLLDGQAEALTQKAVDLAIAGDTTALRLCLERIAPARKSRAVSLSLPKIKGAADIAEALSVVVEAVANGTLDPDEAATIAGVIDVKRRSIETIDMDARLLKLEQSLGAKKP